MQLDTHFQLPKFVGQMNGETVDSWIRSLSTYFKTSPEMEEATKLQIANLQLKGITQTWWDTQLESSELIVELGTPPSPTKLILGMHSVTHCGNASTLQGYLHNILAKWLQLHQLSTQSVQGYIDVFYKLCIQLHVNEPDKVLIIKFNSGLLLPLQREVDLFDNASLEKDFLWHLTIERKVVPHIGYLPNFTRPTPITLPTIDPLKISSPIIPCL
jgi:hypothetical protein